MVVQSNDLCLVAPEQCDAHYLEVRNSTVEGSGLGLFVVCEGGGGWVAGGTLLTEYGDRDRLIDSLDSLDYAMGITGRPYMVRWGPRWEGPVPGRLPRGWQVSECCPPPSCQSYHPAHIQHAEEAVAVSAEL